VHKSCKAHRDVSHQLDNSSTCSSHGISSHSLNERAVGGGYHVLFIILALLFYNNYICVVK